MESPRARLILPVLVTLVFGVWLAIRHHAAPAAPRPAHTESTSDDPSAPIAIADTASAPAALSAPSPSADAPLPLDKAKRDQMRALIWKTFGQPAPASTPTAAKTYKLPDTVPPPAGVEEKLEPKYIQSHVRNEFFPVARDCYGDALKKTPDLAGEVDLYFTIVGNKNIGGIVESVDVLNKSTLRDPEMIECMRESFLSVTFPPPESGGFVTVEYPIIFTPGDGGDED